MDVQLADFLSYVASEKGLALNSVEAYRRDTTAFVLFAQQKGVSTFAEVTHSLIIDYLTHLKSSNYASTSICRALIAIKVLFLFLTRERIIQSNVAYYLETPKLWQSIPEILNAHEINALLSQPDTTTPRGARDKAIIEVLYSSGLRVSEVCSLKIYDVDDEFLRVKGKGSKERLVPIGRKAIAAIDFYLLHYRCLTDSEKEQTLFVSKSGKPLNRIDVWKMIKNYAEQAEINKNISPHTLRHSFATHLLDNGADLRVIQEMLGHAAISSTERYTHISSTHLQKAFQMHHPRYEKN